MTGILSLWNNSMSPSRLCWEWKCPWTVISFLLSIILYWNYLCHSVRFVLCWILELTLYCTNAQWNLLAEGWSLYSDNDNVILVVQSEAVFFQNSCFSTPSVSCGTDHFLLILSGCCRAGWILQCFVCIYHIKTLCLRPWYFTNGCDPNWYNSNSGSDIQAELRSWFLTLFSSKSHQLTPGSVPYSFLCRSKDVNRIQVMKVHPRDVGQIKETLNPWPLLWGVIEAFLMPWFGYYFCF